MTIMAGITVGIVWLACGLFKPIIGVGVDAKEANALIHQRFELPLAAKDVNFYSTVWHTTIDFKISRKDFVEWASHMNWKTTEVGLTLPRPFYYARGFQNDTEPRLVESGLVFPSEYGNEKVFFSGVFDDQIGRASVSYAGR